MDLYKVWLGTEKGMGVTAEKKGVLGPTLGILQHLD